MCHIYSIECKPARAIYPAKDQHCTTVKELLNLHAALLTGNDGIQEKTNKLKETREKRQIKAR